MRHAFRPVSSLVPLAASAAGALFVGLVPAVGVDAAEPAPVATFDLPAPSAVSFSTTATFGPDGLLYAYDGRNVFRQDALNAGAFTKLSTADAPVAGSDAGPIAFTQDGNTIVVGTGGGGVDFANPASNGRFLTVPRVGGTFTDVGTRVPNQYAFAALPAASTAAGESGKLAVNQGTASFDGSFVSYFDLATGANTPVITGIPGASTDVAFDDAGHFYVGVGYDTTPGDRGQVRRFDLAALDGAFATNTPVPFSSGTLLNDADNNGGNGFFVNDDGYLFIGAGNEGGLVTVAPDGTVTSHALGLSSPTLRYNPANDQFAAYEFDGDVFVFESSAFVPEPGVTGLLAVALAGALVRRGRRAAA